MVGRLFTAGHQRLHGLLGILATELATFDQILDELLGLGL